MKDINNDMFDLVLLSLRQADTLHRGRRTGAYRDYRFSNTVKTSRANDT